MGDASALCNLSNVTNTRRLWTSQDTGEHLANERWAACCSSWVKKTKMKESHSAKSQVCQLSKRQKLRRRVTKSGQTPTGYGALTPSRERR